MYATIKEIKTELSRGAYIQFYHGQPILCGAGSESWEMKIDPKHFNQLLINLTEKSLAPEHYGLDHKHYGYFLKSN